MDKESVTNFARQMFRRPHAETEIPRSNIHAKLILGAIEDYPAEAGLRTFIQSADIYVPAYFGWTDRAKIRYDAVVSGRMDPSEAVSDNVEEIGGIGADLGFFSSKGIEFAALFQSGVKVVLLDLPRRNPSAKTQPNETDMFDGVASLKDLSFQEKKDRFQKALGEETKISNIRDENIVGNFLPEIDKVIKKNKKLAKKTDLNVVLKFGIEHAGIGIALRKQGIDVEFVYPEKSYATSYRNKMHLMDKMGKPVPDDLMFRAVLENVGMGLFKDKFDNKIKLEAFSRQVASYFDAEEINQLLGDIDDKSAEAAGAFIAGKIVGKGIELPDVKLHRG